MAISKAGVKSVYSFDYDQSEYQGLWFCTSKYISSSTRVFFVFYNQFCRTSFTKKIQ